MIDNENRVKMEHFAIRKKLFNIPAKHGNEAGLYLVCILETWMDFFYPFKQPSRHFTYASGGANDV